MHICKKYRYNFKENKKVRPILNKSFIKTTDTLHLPNQIIFKKESLLCMYSIYYMSGIHNIVIKKRLNIKRKSSIHKNAISIIKFLITKFKLLNVIHLINRLFFYLILKKITVKLF